ncbi:hemolysin family protein [Micromonospora sp. NBC_01699]|uniref:hemolysin family protein n=1 Tax=Micromonospora sp. NBC_01699 TaxID=2975984 RepID=UPI002E3202E0|nr:hemolysin family protein [Micromonospora sp. NBC_01699]
MGGHGTELGLVLLLVLINAAFAGSEMALVSLREGQMRGLARGSRNGRVLARLARDPNRFLATTQIGITLAGFLASAAAAVSLAEPLIGPLGFLGGAARPAAVVVVTAILTFVTLVLGELAPKRVAMQRAERWGLLVARPLDLFATLVRPVVWLLSAATNLVVRVFGADPHATREDINPEELRELVVSQRGVSPQQREILTGAFEIADRTLREILVPRREVTSLPATMAIEQALLRLAEAGRSRAPVTGPTGLDDVVGVVHIRDLVGGGCRVGERARPAVFLPEMLRVADAMRQLRQHRHQLALVVDERGATDGLITMEDLLAEVVGELYDETDRDVESVVREPDGALLVPGSFPLHDLPDLGITLRVPLTGEYTTVAGLLLAGLGHLPTGPGETLRLPGLTAQVVEVAGHAIRAVRLRTGAEHGQGEPDQGSDDRR